MTNGSKQELEEHLEEALKEYEQKWKDYTYAEGLEYKDLDHEDDLDVDNYGMDPDSHISFSSYEFHILLSYYISTGDPTMWVEAMVDPQTKEIEKMTLKCSWGGNATSERVLREHEGLYKSVAYWVALDSDRVDIQEIRW